MKRQFSVPFNGSDPRQFIERLKPYRENVHDVFLSAPGIDDYFKMDVLRRTPNYYENCLRFLALALKNKIPTVLTINGFYSQTLDMYKETTCMIIDNYVKNYKVSGIVCSDLDIAERMHELQPNLAINTSCNSPHYNVYSLIEWKEKAGIELVNPPRDTVRDLKYLKELKKHGFKIKLLINEFCYLNCGRLTQFCGCSKNISHCRSKDQKMDNPLLTCTLFPEQLKYFDEVVDIYKITGRYMSADYIFNLLDIYIHGRSCRIIDIKGETTNKDFSTSEIDPKLIEYWNHCPRDCYNCKRCENELRRIEESHEKANVIYSNGKDIKFIKSEELQ